MSEMISIGPLFGGTKAYVASPSDAGKEKRGLIVLHEYWGLNDQIKSIADNYAHEGFIAIAPDLFDGKVASDKKEAEELMKSLSDDKAAEIIKNTIDAAREKYGLSHFGITGYCMGGTIAFRSACTIEGFSAAVVFYGDIPADDTLKNLDVPLVFISGTKDKWITPEKVANLVAKANELELPVDSVEYEADHAFANSSRSDVYDKGAAEDSWAKAVAHFSNNL